MPDSPLENRDLHDLLPVTFAADGQSPAMDLLDPATTPLTYPSVYDTTWLARLRNPDQSLAYPAILDQLLTQQYADGSWGSIVPHVHDRVLNTLAMVTLLAEFGAGQRHRASQRQGEQFLWTWADRLHYDLYETIGFELLIPPLLDQARRLGINLPYGHLQRYQRVRAEKLALLPEQGLFAQRTTALFSLEAFAGHADVRDAAGLLLSHGSMSISPSATAFFLSHFPNWHDQFPDSKRYLNALVSQHEGGLPQIAPYDIFVRTWTLSNLWYGGLLDNADAGLQGHYAYLRDHFGPDGVGPASTDLADSDDTAMALILLHRAGYEVDGSVLLRYECAEHFACFPYERNPSISANLHVLEALPTLPAGDQARVREKILAYLWREQRHGTFWVDKWHASPYYPTSLALLILSEAGVGPLEQTVNWMLQTQREDGSWGYYDLATAEETALCLLALLTYHRTIRPLATEMLQRAVQYLELHEQSSLARYPELWVGKVLYTPVPVVRSAVLAAIHLYHSTVGD